MAKTVCPHCGKALPNPEKLGWHLSRECPALVTLATTGKKDGKGARAQR